MRGRASARFLRRASREEVRFCARREQRCRRQSINDAYVSFRARRGEYEETRGDDNLHAFTFERSDGTLVRDSRRRENVEEFL